MRKTNVLKFSVWDLPEKTRAILANGYCIDDDDRHLWIDISSLIDGIVEDRFPGLTYNGGTYRETSLNLVPKAWWALMAFPKEMERSIRALWKKNPDAEIEWD